MTVQAYKPNNYHVLVVILRQNPFVGFTIEGKLTRKSIVLYRAASRLNTDVKLITGEIVL